MSRGRENLTKGEGRRKAEQGYRYSLGDDFLYTQHESIPTGALSLLNPSTPGNSTP